MHSYAWFYDAWWFSYIPRYIPLVRYHLHQPDLRIYKLRILIHFGRCSHISHWISQGYIDRSSYHLTIFVGNYDVKVSSISIYFNIIYFMIMRIPFESNKDSRKKRQIAFLFKQDIPVNHRYHNQAPSQDCWLPWPVLLSL